MISGTARHSCNKTCRYTLTNENTAGINRSISFRSTCRIYITVGHYETLNRHVIMAQWQSDIRDLNLGPSAIYHFRSTCRISITVGHYNIRERHVIMA